MYNLLQRLNAVATFTLTVAFVLMTIVAYTSLYIPNDARVDVTLRAVKVQKGASYPDQFDPSTRRAHHARLAFDIESHAASLFNWNTKQVFMMLVAEYETPENSVNKVVLWDSIIQTPQDAEFHLKKYRNKYRFRDFTEAFGSQQANLTVYWDVTPYIGFLQPHRHVLTMQTFDLPKVSYK
ncbi:Signal peptidase complex subunit [Tieghemiomyces parasiticus]|uniref:Signal peptidase subunit 3 n=1 Tax=Tieghemiomyces parasiticus TaxID=78921 RepID=A0A9W8DPX6_9FUNG|nr:Signal peptidase complex subunit [Tieghemiomyces parasiticus]